MEVIRAPNCAHNDPGNCPGVCSVRKQSKSSRRFLCVVPDALLPEASFLCPTLVENKSVGLGKYLDKVMSDAAACRNGRATQHGNSCWRGASLGGACSWQYSWEPCRPARAVAAGVGAHRYSCARGTLKTASRRAAAHCASQPRRLSPKGTAPSGGRYPGLPSGPGGPRGPPVRSKPPHGS